MRCDSLRLGAQVVQITPEHLSEEELIALFKKRLQPIQSEVDKLGAPQISVRAPTRATRVMPPCVLPPYAPLATWQVFVANEMLWLGLYLLGFPFAIIPATMIPLFHGLYFLA